MRLRRVIGLIVLAIILVAVISEPVSSAETARAGGRALASAGESIREFATSVISGASSDGSTNGAGSTSTAATTAEASYVVQPGDTLSSIASSRGESAETLADLNDLADPDLIVPGQQLSLP